jgi:hypothetical protein
VATLAGISRLKGQPFWGLRSAVSQCDRLTVNNALCVWRFWQKTADALLVAFSAVFLLFALDQFCHSLQAFPRIRTRLCVFLPSCQIRTADLRGAAKKSKMTQRNLMAPCLLLRSDHRAVVRLRLPVERKLSNSFNVAAFRGDIGCASNFPVIGSWFPCSAEIIPCYSSQRISIETPHGCCIKRGSRRRPWSIFAIFPVYFPVSREIQVETGSHETASSASQPVPSLRRVSLSWQNLRHVRHLAGLSSVSAPKLAAVMGAQPAVLAPSLRPQFRNIRIL